MYQNFSAMSAMDRPTGLPLANQAVEYARRARVQELQPNTQEQQTARNSSVIDLVRICHAINRGNEVSRIRAVVALQEFLRAPDQMRRRHRAALREMVTASDMPAGAALQAYIDKFIITPGEMDTGYEAIFAIHDVATAEMQLLKGEFKVLNVTSGITFSKRLPGEPVKLKNISAAEASVPYDMYGGGVSIERVWWDDQDYLMISDILTMFREAYYYNRAQSFYALITGLSSSINYSTGADLIAKMNGAAATIIRNAQGKGYAANANSEFVVLHAPEKAGEVDGALRTQSDFALQTAAGKQRLKYRFRTVSSVHVPASGDGSGIYVILPKGQLKGGYRMDLTLFGRFDPLSYADDLSGFGRYAGVVADTAQVRRIP